jgi:hypothetical protein
MRECEGRIKLERSQQIRKGLIFTIQFFQGSGTVHIRDGEYRVKRYCFREIADGGIITG